MKIFGFEIGKKKEPEQLELPMVQDEIPEVKTVIPKTKKPAVMPRVQDPALRYHATRARGRGHFQPSEYNLAEVGRIEDTDSYVRQSFNKKTALMFKEGWDIVGADPRTIKYVKTRFAQIARASRVPTQELFRSIGAALIKKSNAFVVKVRKAAASGGRRRREPGKNTLMDPVAGYFIVPAETMEFQLNGNKIVRWKQKMPNGLYKFYKPDDVIHFHYDRKEGFMFGTPTITPVIDDIRALRKIEENIELLVYQHLFPLFQYKVGTENAPAGVTEAGEDEIEVVRREIMYMPTEGGIVTPERHEIKAIGAEGRALRAEGYLEHFKKRVFAGLGVSAVDMGEGETANRATADNMSRNLIDAVKDFQQVMEVFVNEHVINELLLESTFGTSVLDEERRCWMKFKEIDTEQQIKREAHGADLFAKDIITWPEARVRLGLEAIKVPTTEEIDAGTATAEKYPDWHMTRWKLFREPELLIQSLDEPYSPLAKAAAKNTSLEATGADIDEAGEQKKQQEIDLEKERTKAKIAVAKAKPKTTTRPSQAKRKDGYLADTYVMVMKDVVNRVKDSEQVDWDWVAALVRTEMGTTMKQLLADQVLAFHKGYSLHHAIESDQFVRDMALARRLFTDRAEHYVTKLTEHVISSLRRNVTEDLNHHDKVAKVRAVFGSSEYRTKFIEDVEIRKARRWGEFVAQRHTNFTLNKAMYTQATGEDPCLRCQAQSGQLKQLEFVTMEDVPPYHANCTCEMMFTEQTPVPVSDGVIDKPEKGDIAETEYRECPKCGKTAIRTKNTPDTFNCKACGHTFTEIKDDKPEKPEETKDKASNPDFEKCMGKARARLAKQHPDWDAQKVDMVAEAACDHLRSMTTEDDVDIEDGKLERCVLKVKSQLRKDHPDWSEDKIKSSAFAICNSQLKGK